MEIRNDLRFVDSNFPCYLHIIGNIIFRTIVSPAILCLLLPLNALQKIKFIKYQMHQMV